jgi:DNA-binding CsgD family transcriptional regulator
MDMSRLYQEYTEILDLQKFDPADLDPAILEYHIRFVRQLDVIDSSCISIFDLYKRDHVFYSDKFSTVFGWNLDDAHREGADYATRRIHPDDLPLTVSSGNYFLRMSLEMSGEEKKDYKLIQEYRIERHRGEFVQVVEQHQVLELDRRGNVWLSIGLMDLSPDQTDPGFRCRLMNFKTGELYSFPPPDTDPLTRREKEILNLIANGLMSKEIADRLFISVNTVNTHRQRILEKLGAESSIEAIRYAKEKGILGF